MQKGAFLCGIRDELPLILLASAVFVRFPVVSWPTGVTGRLVGAHFMSRGVIYRIGAPAERGRNRCGNQSPQGTPSSCSATPAPQQSLAAVVLCCVIVPVLGTGNGSVFRLGVQPAPPSDFIASLALGASHTCVLMSDGDVRCWGGNSRGQLGSGGFTDALLPTGVAAFTGART